MMRSNRLLFESSFFIKVFSVSLRARDSIVDSNEWKNVEKIVKLLNNWIFFI